MRFLIFALALAACSPAAQTTPPDATEPATPSLEASATPATNLARMPGWDAARAAGVDFRGVGQEPGWMLDIYTNGNIKFVYDYGEHYAELAAGQPNTTQEGATRYEAHSDGVSVAVTIRRFPCQDAMSGEGYPSTVEVVVDGRTLNGCGKSV